MSVISVVRTFKKCLKTDSRWWFIGWVLGANGDTAAVELPTGHRYNDLTY